MPEGVWRKPGTDLLYLPGLDQHLTLLASEQSQMRNTTGKSGGNITPSARAVMNAVLNFM